MKALRLGSLALLLLPGLVLTAAAGASGRAAPPPSRPNIVLIMADDMGFSDAGCYGGEIRTPNLDRLASAGLRFTQFYNAARCCPTRASLMTGLYPHQAGVGRMTFDQGKPGYRGHLTQNTVTVAELLRQAGYRTAMTGKWHLSLTKDGPRNAEWVSHRLDLGPFSDPKTYPVNRGFEEHYGTIWGVVDFFDPFSLVHNEKPVESVPPGYYYTDAITENSVRLLDKYGRGDDPFFLYVAYTAPHWPLHALSREIDRYRETYSGGWDRTREARYQRLIRVGLLPADRAPLSPPMDPDVRWDTSSTKEWDARAMAVHAAMIDRMDQGIGRIVRRLEELKKRENTLVMFLSDNGASPEVPSEPGFDRPSTTRDGRPLRYTTRKDVLPGPQETFGAIGRKWANAANTPFRFWKAQLFEGGICTPLIASWPRVMRQQGGITHQPGHVIDITATCLDLARARYPATFKGRTITPVEGRSLVPVLKGATRKPHPALYWEHFGARAVRQGDWKMVARPNSPWELYDLAADRTEVNDLAAQHPERVRELEALYRQWAHRAQVIPAP